MDYLKVYPQLYLIRDMLCCTIGQDPNVNVGPLNKKDCEHYEICIGVNGQSRAEAIRTIVPCEYNYGSEKVCTKIFSKQEEIIFPLVCPKSDRQVANVFCMALSTNQFFCGVSLGKEKLIPICNEVKVWLKDECIHFHGNNCYQQRVAEVFDQVLKLRYGLILLTKVEFVSYQRGCNRPCEWYCQKNF